MRIAKKDIERLEYVERALSKRDDHLAKVVHNVLQELNPEFIFIIQEEGCWDGELSHHTEAYASFGDAVNSFKNLARSAGLNMRKLVRDPSKLEESEQIDEETQTANYKICYKICNIENGIYFHDTISITKKEVI